MADFSVQPVVVESTGGWSLPGQLWRPQPSKANGKSVLLLHQLRKDRRDWDALAVLLASKGFGVLAVDFRGHGESRLNGKPAGVSGGKSWDSFDEKAGEFLGLKDDAKAAWDFLRRALPLDRSFVVGSSVGGNCAVLLAADASNGVSGIALLSAGFNYRGVDCRSAVASVPGPAFVSASREDGYAFHCCERMAATIPNAEWVPMDSAGHGVELFKHGVQERLVAWLLAR